MYMQLVRLKDNGSSTIGTLSVDGEFNCFTLEDTHNEPKIFGKTRIPTGEYEIALRNEGGMTKKYASKYGNAHKGMVWLQNVENFEWVYIHVGNYSKDTDGCILVGNGADVSNGSISQSRAAYLALYTKITDTLEAGEPVTIQVI